MGLNDLKWIAGVVLAVTSATGFAQQRMTLQDAASKAVLTNPEVKARLHTFRAAGFERRVGFGGYLPTLDVIGSLGRGHLDDPLLTTNATSYTYNNVSIIARQMLFDGLATRNDVKRLDHARRVRYFELLDTSETAALEAIRAYNDVLRYQRLLEFAEEHYAQHRIVNDQLTQRAKQGVSRGVDLELAVGRLALAESNLLTETSNLHDVSARFQRIVGEPPQALADSPKPLTAGVPASPVAALNAAFDRSPQLLAAMENIQAAQSDVEVRRAAYWPRLEARVQHDTGKDINGVIGHTGSTVGELALRFNVFNGGRDVARVSQYAELANVAKDLRDRTCREVRQAVLIALNDVNKLREQAAFLDQHQLSTDKARQAFRDQFDIGQRSLLDLLDTENEFFQSRRAYINAEYDLNTAYARLHAATGNLLSALGIAPVEMNAPAEVEPMGADASARCPAEGPGAIVVDKQRAIEKAMRLRPVRPQTTPAPGAVPAPAPKPKAKP